jgi:hypothetical protein
MKDKGWGVEDVIGFITVAVIAVALVWMVYAMAGGEKDHAPATGTYCEVHEGFMGQQVVTCERD